MLQIIDHPVDFCPEKVGLGRGEGGAGGAGGSEPRSGELTTGSGKGYNFYKVLPQSKLCCFKVIRTNYNEKKKSKEKTTRELVLPIFQTVNLPFLWGFNENIESRYNM